MLIANPIAAEAALDAAAIEAGIAAAIRAADAAGIGGKALTPFLLDHINRNSGGKSLAANLALALGNARLGGTLAAALAQPQSAHS